MSANFPGTDADRERASAWILERRAGLLSTLTETGEPFGSVVPFSVDRGARIRLFISPLAQHTRNLQANAAAALTLWEEGVSPASGACRICIQVRASVAAPSPEEEARFFGRNPDTGPWRQLGFVFYTLQASRVHVILGFGRAGWCDAAELFG